MNISSTVKIIVSTAIIWMSRLLYYPYLARFFLLSKNKSRRLHVGCGKNYFNGWLNADINPRADLILVIEKKLPFSIGSLDRIYSEHVLEHVSYETGVFFLKEAFRTLRTGGIIRIAMPDLDALIDGYQKDWHLLDWVNWPEYKFIKTKG